jgi:hypothetical protein
MNETKYFKLTEANPINVYMIMQIVAARCAGKDKDPDSNHDYTSYEYCDISIIRSSKAMPEAMKNHNVVSNLTFEFSVQELAEDFTSENTNPKVEHLGHSVAKLPIRRAPSHFFLKVELS